MIDTRPIQLVVWIAVVFLILAGFAAWIFEPEVCITGQVIDSTSHTVFPIECS